MGRLFWKFFFFFFFAQLTTALAVGAFIQFQANDRANKERVDLSPVSKSLVEAAQTTLQFGGVDGLTQLLQRWELQGLRHHVYVVDQEQRDLLGRTIAPGLIKKARRSTRAVLRSSVANVRINDTPYVIFVGTHRMDKRARHAGMPPLHIRHNPFLRTIQSFPLKALMIAAIASALFAAILAWYFSKPIASLRSAFKQAADGDLNVGVSDKMGSRNDELADLGHHFDYMAKQLHALMQGQTRLLHHVSHELRSPLARVQMALGLATQNPDNVQSALNRIEKEAGRMDKLIGELLELSRFESGMVELAKEHFSLNDMMNTIADDANFEAAKKQVKIVAEIPAAIVFYGQPDLIQRANENVVRNAVKYGPEGSIVTINCLIDKANQSLNIEVLDQGAGVLPDELEAIFKPFVRGNTGSQVNGHGVGLAIAKQVVEAHGGSVLARNMSPVGFSMVFTFPQQTYSISPDT